MSAPPVAFPPSPIPTASDPARAAELKSMAGFTRPVKKTLDQQDFLKLLSTQLAHQDPMNPQTDLTSISQMASFSSAQQMSELVTSLKSFIVTQDFASAQAMLGKYVTVETGTTIDPETRKTIKTTVSGLVSKVGYDENGTSIITVGDKTYSPSAVVGIQSTPPAPVVTNPPPPAPTEIGPPPVLPPASEPGTVAEPPET